MRELYSAFTRTVERAVAAPWAFLTALALVLAWAVSGPIFGWSQTWQLVINTGTTIVTFLMVFLVQHTQTRDTAAIQAKLDELIAATEDARDDLIGAEKLDEQAIERVRRSPADGRTTARTRP